MRDQLVLLPGWGLGTAPLEPLAAALRGLDQSLTVEIQPLPVLTSNAPTDWLDALDALIPPDVWLGGWSLGGMLAAELAARRAGRCSGLVSLASNSCFVARQDWPCAMPADSFRDFRDGCARDPAQTLKRFGLLCSQGAKDPRGLARRLAADDSPLPAEALLAGLHVLGALDTRAALQAFSGPQLHLFAGGDGLVPYSAASALLALLPDVEVGVLEQASHAFVLERPHEVATSICAFLGEVADD